MALRVTAPRLATASIRFQYVSCAHSRKFYRLLYDSVKSLDNYLSFQSIKPNHNYLFFSEDYQKKMMIRSSNLSLEFVRKFGIELSPIRLHPHPPTRGTHETRSRALTRGRHARTHASWERRSCVPSILLAPRRKLGERARRRTNGQEGGEGGAGRGRNATNFRAARRVYHCPRIPAELRVHGNKGKCASPIGSDRSIETVNPIYVAVISIILCLRSYYHFPPASNEISAPFFDR